MLGLHVGSPRDSFTPRPFLFMPAERGKNRTKSKHLTYLDA